MSYDDWNPDDFLDFDYGKKDSSKDIKSGFDEYDEYLASRKKNVNGVKSDTKRSKHSDIEYKALKKAQQEAHERYRSNYDKNYKRKYGNKRKVTPTAWIARIYLIALAVFAASMAIMDVLPVWWLLILLLMLVLISIFVLPRMRRGGKKRGTKAIATMISVLLIFLYGVGTAYALGTLSFLSSTSVSNKKHVSRITRDPFNVVITGMDVDGKINEEGRSDVNMVLTVNPKTAQLLMTSIPRDYQVFLRDKDNAMDKLTHTGFYGVESTIAAEEDLLGITANYYIKVNFTTVEKFIDAVGGIDVYSEHEFEPVKLKEWTVKEGMNHMNGEQALAFARERKAFDDGDRQRIKNQQAVFEAMFKKATSSKTMLLNYSNVLYELKDYFEMSFSSREIRSLIKHQIAKNLDWSIFKTTLTGDDDMQALYGTGMEYAYVMAQDEENISHAKKLIDAVMKGEQLTKDKNGFVDVINSEDDSESEAEE